MIEVFHEIEWKVYKKGVVINKGRQKGHSYLRNWVNLIRAHFAKTREVVVREDGTTATVGYVQQWCNNQGQDIEWGYWMNAGDNDDTYGLVIGYGTTPPTPDDYKLEKKYPHGSGMGYFDYETTKIYNIVIEDNKLKFSIERAFTNNYDSPQDINEVGLILYCREKFPGIVDTNAKILIMRDVLETTLTVPAYATAVIRYDIYFIV